MIHTEMPQMMYDKDGEVMTVDWTQSYYYKHGYMYNGNPVKIVLYSFLSSVHKCI